MQHLKAAEPWVAQPTARQLLDVAPDIPTKRHFALRLPFGYSGASPYQVCLPAHKPHAVWRDLDPTIQLLLLKQVKGRLSERDWLVLVREIQ